MKNKKPIVKFLSRLAKTDQEICFRRVQFSCPVRKKNIPYFLE